MHPDEAIVREMLTAHSTGNEQRLSELLTPDVVYHVPGENDLSGDYLGLEEVFNLWRKQVEIIGRRFVPHHFDVLACDYHVIVIVDSEHIRNGVIYRWRMANVYHLRDGQIRECWIGVVDGIDDFDRFWSANAALAGRAMTELGNYRARRG